MPAQWIKDIIYDRVELVVSTPSTIHGEHRVHAIFESTFMPTPERYRHMPYSYHYGRNEVALLQVEALMKRVRDALV